ncbi:hypothetical protein AVEN_212903-1 [Araneus ventricosus]|uniref:Tesmin/TSO1-like CXC domain-containing protein n=1 Tax=Araneus ventricosus TaxID=182803 RepID=A0A4Y2DXM9_ARAVE|nr:hypothetical protein AVEN_212903-1 [Araneus ventricosus]
MLMPKKGNQQEKVHSILDIHRDIGEMKDVLLVVYAFTGCNTVSAIYRKGKIVPLKKVQANKALHTKLLRFNDPNADPNAVADAGKHFLLSLFGTRNIDGLDTPTPPMLFADDRKTACAFHVQCGWKTIGGHLRPITTTHPAAPKDLLSLIVCTCKDECVQNFECRRSGLNCSNMCSNCSGLECVNRDMLIIEDNVDDLQLDEEQEDSFPTTRLNELFDAE